MDRADVQPLTTIYQQCYGPLYLDRRTVVLATGTWAPVNADGTPFLGLANPATTFAEIHIRVPPSARTGWLVLVNELFTAAGAPTDQEMLTQAARAWAAIQAGRLPTDLTDGLRVTTLPAEEILPTPNADQQRRPPTAGFEPAPPASARPVLDILIWTATAAASGVVGSLTWEALKDSARKARYQSLPEEIATIRPDVWSAGRQAIIDRYADHLESTGHALCTWPDHEEVFSNGQWNLHFRTDGDAEYTVTLGPPARHSTWKKSIKSVSAGRPQRTPRLEVMNTPCPPPHPPSPPHPTD